jgi:hypothetical protein
MSLPDDGSVSEILETFEEPLINAVNAILSKISHRNEELQLLCPDLIRGYDVDRNFDFDGHPCVVRSKYQREFPLKDYFAYNEVMNDKSRANTRVSFSAVEMQNGDYSLSSGLAENMINALMCIVSHGTPVIYSYCLIVSHDPLSNQTSGLISFSISYSGLQRFLFSSDAERLAYEVQHACNDNRTYDFLSSIGKQSIVDSHFRNHITECVNEGLRTLLMKEEMRS